MGPGGIDKFGSARVLPSKCMNLLGFQDV